MSALVVRVPPFGREEKTLTVSGVGYRMQAAFGDTLEFHFADGVIDLSRLRLLYTHARAGPFATANESQPRDTECAFEKLEVLLGNTVIDSIEDHHMLFHTLSTYAMDSSFQVGTSALQRHWTNRRLTTTGRDLNGAQFCAEKFVGLLGSGALIDTRKYGKLTVRIKLVPQTFITTTSTTNIHGVRDMFFRATYMPDDTPTTNTISFDSFLSTRIAHPSYTSKSTFVVDGRKRLKYVLVKHVSVSSHLSRATVVHSPTNLTSNFLSSGELVNTWNIAVNEKRLNTTPCSRAEGMASMKEIFPDGVFNTMPFADAAQGENMHMNRPWACGALLNLVQKPDGQQHEISYVMDAVAAGNGVPQMTYMHVCFPVVVDVSSGQLVVSS